MSKINCKSYLDSILNEENYKIHFFNGIDDIQSELQTIKIQRAFGDTRKRKDFKYFFANKEILQKVLQIETDNVYLMSKIGLYGTKIIRCPLEVAGFPVFIRHQEESLESYQRTLRKERPR